MNSPRIPLYFGLVASVVLSACGGATAPVKEDYAATMPEEIPADQAANGSIFQNGHDRPLFQNAIAHHVGDTITIHLVESYTAQKSSSTSTAKTSSESVTAPTIGKSTIYPLGIGLGSNNAFNGSGDSKLSNQLQGDITVTVAKRLSNGNLVVRGEKSISINLGREVVRLQGIIRPIDIQLDNTITSNLVANATISYGGQGELADASTPGLLSKFFNSKWNPF